MQSKDGAAHTLFWENLNIVMKENGVSTVNYGGQCSCKLECDQDDIWLM